MSSLIDVAELARVLEDARRPVRILDVRWRLDVPEGRPQYLAGHIPGAVYVDLERELALRGYPEAGRHPLPPVDDLQESARRWGVDDGDLVVAYDDNDGIPAARAWWLLRRRGVDIRVLDGGLRAWIEAGRPLDTHDVAPRPGEVTLIDADPGTASIDEVSVAPKRGVLLDARAPRHYRGQSGTTDPVAGHIPGAINLPTVTHIAPDGRLKSPAAIRSALTDVGVTAEVPVVVYCSSGLASAHTALALSRVGIEPRVFPGSWSQWSRSRGRQVAVGTTPASTVYGI